MNDLRIPVSKEEVRALNASGILRSRNGRQRLIVWHRRIGLASALLVIFLALSGLLLNHANRLGLDQSQVNADWLLRWYGFPPAQEPVGFRAGERWLSWTGARLLLDRKPVMESQTAPIGAAALSDRLLAAAFPDALVLIDADGAVVERLGAESLPGALQRIGMQPGGALAIQTSQGRFSGAANLLEWQPTSADAAWSGAEAVPAVLRTHLMQMQRGPGIPASRVLQDLHSGRIFGAWGPWLMDAAAIAFVIMAVTGIIHWYRQRRRALIYRRRGADRRHHR